MLPLEAMRKVILTDEGGALIPCDSLYDPANCLVRDPKPFCKRPATEIRMTSLIDGPYFIHLHLREFMPMVGLPKFTPPFFGHILRVFFMRTGPEVPRIAAKPIVAIMTNQHPRRNAPVLKRIRRPMGDEPENFPENSCGQSAVTLLGDCSFPFPAFVLPRNIHPGKEPIQECLVNLITIDIRFRHTASSLYGV